MSDVFKLFSFIGRRKVDIVLGWEINSLNIKCGQHLVNDVDGHANRLEIHIN
jgi:hypothetical protein